MATNITIHDSDNTTIHSSSGADVIIALGDNNRIFGDGGNDTIMGNEGDNTIFGGAGRDVILGGSGDNFLSGGTSNDVISAGTGDDTLNGGANNGTIRYTDFVILIYPPVSNVITTGGDTLIGGSGENLFVVTEASTVTTIVNFDASEDTVLISGYDESLAVGFGTNTITFFDGIHETAIVGANQYWTLDSFTFE